MKDQNNYIYYNEYLKAIRNPLKQLRETFNEESDILAALSKGKIIVGIGCGANRMLMRISELCKEFVYVDSDARLLELASEYVAVTKNVGAIKSDLTQTPLDENYSDVTFSTYNLIGSIDKKESLIKEMVRVTKKGGIVAVFYWKQDFITTEFLKLYYPSIGLKINSVTSEETITDKGTFERINSMFIERLFTHEGLTNVKTTDVGPVWYMTSGTKNS